MNQRFDPTDRPVNPAAWPADQAGQRIDSVTSAPVNDPLLNQRRPEEVEVRSSRSTWPVLIILLAGLVLALLVWLPAEMSTDTATPPATTEQSATPADNATPPVDNSATPGTATPDTSVTPNATPATPDTQTPATGADQQPQTNGMAPQTNETAPAN